MRSIKLLIYLVFWPVILLFYLFVPSFREFFKEEFKDVSR